MKALFYIIAVIFGLFGLLSLVRFLETAAFGGGILPVQLLIGVVGIGVAIVCIKKARAT